MTGIDFSNTFGRMALFLPSSYKVVTDQCLVNVIRKLLFTLKASISLNLYDCEFGRWLSVVKDRLPRLLYIFGLSWRAISDTPVQLVLTSSSLFVRLLVRRKSYQSWNRKWIGRLPVRSGNVRPLEKYFCFKLQHLRWNICRFTQ